MSDLKPFLFEANGETHELPDMRVLSARQLQAASRGDFEVLEKALHDNGADQSAIDALMDMPLHRLNDVIGDWVRSGEGKASLSSPSSSTTATRSKPTSRSGGSRSKR